MMNERSNNPAFYRISFGVQEEGKEHNPCLGESDHIKSHAFTAPANQYSEDLPPPPSKGMNAIFYNQASDLHPSETEFQSGSPPPIFDFENHTNPVSAVDIPHFHHLLDPQMFRNSNPFAQRESYAPSSFVHQNSGYETMNPQQNNLPDEKLAMDSVLHKDSNYAGYSARTFENMHAPSLQLMEKFRYQVILDAPAAMTAMIQHSNETPVTYLNKGQVYRVSICDSTGLGPASDPVKYRTVIRISFDDEQRRQQPSAFWQIWKEGRYLTAVQQRERKLQAVEYVDLEQGGNQETQQSRVELETTSFNCFSVTWIPSQGSTTAECSVAVRFNFLSTDFSHSRRGNGIPVRFCAKTEVISGNPDSPSGPVSEVCFCKVQLFHDYGAERRFSRDVANIKKTIDKLKQEFWQVEHGVKEVGQRKRSGADEGGSHRPGKVRKHKRTGSVLSQDSSSRPTVGEDLHKELATIQNSLTSTRPVSVLHLKGDGQDAYPVSLPGEPTDLTRISGSTPTNSCHVSPSPKLSTQKTHCKAGSRQGKRQVRRLDGKERH